MPFIKLSDIQEREMVPGFRARFVHTDRMTCAYWTITAGALLPEHAHPHEQVTNVIRGRFEMTVDGETQTIEPGSLLVIPSGAKHRGRALTDCFILDVFVSRPRGLPVNRLRNQGLDELHPRLQLGDGDPFLRRMGVLFADPEPHAGKAPGVEDVGVHAAAGGPEPGFDAQGAGRAEGVGDDRMRLFDGEGHKRLLPPDGHTGARGRRLGVKGIQDRLNLALQLIRIGAPDLDGHLGPVGDDIPDLPPADDADVRGGLRIDAAGAETGDGLGGGDDGVDPLLGADPRMGRPAFHHEIEIHLGGGLIDDGAHGPVAVEDVAEIGRERLGQIA